VKEKLLVNRYNERLDVSCRKKRTYQRGGFCCRSRAKVGRLANLASSFILSLSMGMGKDLGNKQNAQHRQSNSEHPGDIRSRLVATSHVDNYTTPIFLLTLGRLPCEQPHRWFSPEVHSQNNSLFPGIIMDCDERWKTPDIDCSCGHNYASSRKWREYFTIVWNASKALAQSRPDYLRGVSLLSVSGCIVSGSCSFEMQHFCPKAILSVCSKLDGT